MANAKTGKTETDDPVLAALLKQREEVLGKLDAKISERKRRMQGQERKNRNRLLMLTGIAYHADAELHPQLNNEIRAMLDRAITGDKDRAFLKSIGWLENTAKTAAAPDSGSESKKISL